MSIKNRSIVAGLFTYSLLYLFLLFAVILAEWGFSGAA